MTWAPVLAAGAFTIDHFDRRVSDWAADHTPLFGSRSSAGSASDDLVLVSLGGTVVTALATPSGTEPGEWFANKAKGLAVEAGAVLAAEGATEGLKLGVDRRRPNDVGTESFPSGHSTFAFALATETSRNLESLSLSPGFEMAAQIGSYTIAGTVAWARVEAHKHFPSDVLAGMAIGHFVAAFIHDAFLGVGGDRFPEITIAPLDGGGLFEVAWSF